MVWMVKSMTEFDQVILRKNTASVKWDSMKVVYGEADLLPMWVADMDFLPPKAVIHALQERLNHGVFGYTVVPESTALAIKDWLKNRHQWDIDTSWLLYNSGVVPSLGTIILALTEPGENVLLQSPVYTPFFTMIEKNNRNVVNCPLQLVDERFEIDFSAFEETLQNGVKLFLLCNPHNPGGRVWSSVELKKIAELCHKYNVIIVADEIHSDLVGSPYRHIPITSINPDYQDFVITCIAPSKTFNLAGLQASCMIIPNEALRETVKNIQEKQGFHTLNVFGIVGMEAAYRHGQHWLDELLVYVQKNLQLVKNFIEQELPTIKVMEPEGGYLIWLDCRETGLSDDELMNHLLLKGKLALEPGTKYGLGGEGFLRMNVGCPREMVQDGLERLKFALT
jgi:cysteine-S-conjugate beta-lyase